MRHPKKLSIILFVISILFGASALAEGNGKGNGKNRNLGHGNASDGVKGLIQTNRGVVYTGDPLDISVKFPRGSDLISSGEVDVWILVYGPDAVPLALPISDLASPQHRKVFSVDAVDVAALPEGVYQLGLVLTVPGGDPLQIADWYNGLLGLINIQGVTVSAEPLDVDEDGDGEIDGDQDGDGFVDEEPVDEEPVDEEPVDEEPVDEQPVDEEPVNEEPTNEEPTDGDTTGNDPAGDSTDDNSTGEDTTV